ncbi:MAG: ATP-binding protein [Syntrophobacteraceae bacterium]
MRNPISLKTRLLVSIWLILIIGVLLPFYFFHRDFTREIIAESRRDAIQQMDHIHWLLSSEKSFRSTEELRDWLAKVGKQLNARITYIGRDGGAIADSQLSAEEVAKFENLSGRPEFLQAMYEDTGTAVRYSKISGQEHIFIAKRISIEGPFAPGVLRLAFPFSPVKTLLDRLSGGLILIISIVFAATLVLGWAIIRRLRAPVSEMVTAVDAIGAGDFKHRIHTRSEQVLYPLTVAINRMGENIGKRISEISTQRQHLEAVFDGMREGVMVLNSKGRVLEVNRAFSELVAPREASLGRNPLEVVRNIEFQEACERILAQTGPEAQAETIEVPMGRDRVFNVNIVRIRDHNQCVGAIVVFHDISNIKRLERVRQDFVANVSRELGAPLVSIKTHVEKIVAEDTSLDNKTRGSLLFVAKESGHMLRIVKDLLQLAALDSRPKHSRGLSANPADALAAAWDGCRSAAVEKDIHLESALPETGIEIAADFDQLVRVFRNLLENGIKYSIEGGKLSVGHRVEEGKAVFSVRDEGPGIPRAHQHRIFERFYRAGQPITGIQASTGLGLAICKHIVQNHGGTIWVESPNPLEQNGATFFFSMNPARESKCIEEPRSQECVLH